MKDLSNANKLDEIKWIFNGAKNPPDFRKNMIKAIDNLPLTDDLANKFFPNIIDADAEFLRQELKTEIDNIFHLIK